MSPPYVVALSLLDVRGLAMGVSQRLFDDEHVRIDRDNLVIPETVIEETTVEPHTVLRPLFDAVWNAVWNAVGWRASRTTPKTARGSRPARRRSGLGVCRGRGDGEGSRKSCGRLSALVSAG